MRVRSSSSPAHDRLVIQPSVAAHGSCWRRQARSVVTDTSIPSTGAADRDGTVSGTEALTDTSTEPGTEPGTEPCGDGRSPHLDNN